ncbi:MAG: hypothetical protein E6562_08675 [Pantoea sp.]|uniref:hypothetical protein n=1 Tax=Pantoea sp. TaxID=69393 RepID=UPI002915A4F0|nr:hypothetical protein [Pantoea sp.]MDU6388651.1 hypothetical protein [Pantoea sp.]
MRAKDYVKLVGALSPEDAADRQDSHNERSFDHGGGNGGGGDMNIRITRIEAMMEAQLQLNRDMRQEMRGIRSDIQSASSEFKNSERRLLDKIDENHKWVTALIISSILVPLLIALVTK